MEIVLISDGPLSQESPAKKLPYFFSARIVDMSAVSTKTAGEARVIVIELLDASTGGLVALKNAWKSFSNTPVICLVSKKNRREVIQAGALGKAELVEREAPFAVLVRTIRGLLNEDLVVRVPDRVSARTVEAYLKGNSFLESQCLSVSESSTIQTHLMNDSASEIRSALALDGLPSWLEAVETHHSATYRHSLIVAGVAGAFARYLGWSDADCQEVIAGGLLHDIGKAQIPLRILDKPSRLTEEERIIVNRHPQFGCNVLKPRPEVPADIKKMAMQHHEFLDGSGYPNGLSGEQISPKVRLMTICDIFTALTEKRPYKEGYAPRVALSMMQDMGGKLDRSMLKQFAAMVLNRDFGKVKRNPDLRRGKASA